MAQLARAFARVSLASSIRLAYPSRRRLQPDSRLDGVNPNAARAGPVDDTAQVYLDAVLAAALEAVRRAL